MPWARPSAWHPLRGFQRSHLPVVSTPLKNLHGLPAWGPGPGSWEQGDWGSSGGPTAAGASGCPPPSCRSVLPFSPQGDHVPCPGVNKASLSLLSRWGVGCWLRLEEGMWWWGDETEARPSRPHPQLPQPSGVAPGGRGSPAVRFAGQLRALSVTWARAARASLTVSGGVFSW